MDDYRNPDGRCDEIESQIRRAGNYVQVSEDLRPRVLEAARTQRLQRRVLHRVQLVAVLALLLGTLGLRIFSWSPTSQLGMSTLRGPWFWLTATEGIARPGDGNWSLVESFTELRRRQAEVLRPTPARPPRGV